MLAKDEMPRASSNDSAWVEIGRVLRPHGVRGALNVALYGDDPANLLGAPKVRLVLGARSRDFALEGADMSVASRDTGARLRVRLVGLGDRDAAREWTGAQLAIPESALRPLPAGEFYWRELLGARVRDVSGAELGSVDEIWPTREHDVLLLREGSVVRMLAVREGTIVELDRAARVLTVDWPGEPEGDS
jgi:16S rRNA processing protein RimM